LSYLAKVGVDQGPLLRFTDLVININRNATNTETPGTTRNRALPWLRLRQMLEVARSNHGVHSYAAVELLDQAAPLSANLQRHAGWCPAHDLRHSDPLLEHSFTDALPRLGVTTRLQPPHSLEARPAFL
jgi:hypothetical protein